MGFLLFLTSTETADLSEKAYKKLLKISKEKLDLELIYAHYLTVLNTFEKNDKTNKLKQYLLKIIGNKTNDQESLKLLQNFFNKLNNKTEREFAIKNIAFPEEGKLISDCSELLSQMKLSGFDIENKTYTPAKLSTTPIENKETDSNRALLESFSQLLKSAEKKMRSGKPGLVIFDTANTLLEKEENSLIRYSQTNLELSSKQTDSPVYKFELSNESHPSNLFEEISQKMASSEKAYFQISAQALSNPSKINQLLSFYKIISDEHSYNNINFSEAVLVMFINSSSIPADSSAIRTLKGLETRISYKKASNTPRFGNISDISVSIQAAFKKHTLRGGQGKGGILIFESNDNLLDLHASNIESKFRDFASSNQRPFVLGNLKEIKNISSFFSSLATIRANKHPRFKNPKSKAPVVFIKGFNELSQEKESHILSQFKILYEETSLKDIDNQKTFMGDMLISVLLPEQPYYKGKVNNSLQASIYRIRESLKSRAIIKSLQNDSKTLSLTTPLREIQVPLSIPSHPKKNLPSDLSLKESLFQQIKAAKSHARDKEGGILLLLSEEKQLETLSLQVVNELETLFSESRRTTLQFNVSTVKEFEKAMRQLTNILAGKHPSYKLKEAPAVLINIEKETPPEVESLLLNTLKIMYDNPSAKDIDNKNIYIGNVFISVLMPSRDYYFKASSHSNLLQLKRTFDSIVKGGRGSLKILN